MQGVSLDQLLGQAGGTAQSQVNAVGVLTVLHGTLQDVLQVLIGGQLDLDAGGSLEGSGDIGPDLGAVSGLDGSDLDGHGLGHGSGGLGGVVARLGSSGLNGLAAAGNQTHDHDQSQNKCNDLLHLCFLH